MSEITSARELYDCLVQFYDESITQPPIKKGDETHTTICNYRNALPKKNLPPGEAQFMRDLLYLSRQPSLEEKREAQTVAENWAKLLLRKYPRLVMDDPEQASELGVDSPPAVYLGNGRVQILNRNNDVIITTNSLINVLEFLVEKRRATTKELSQFHSNPSKAISELCEFENRVLADLIIRPTKSGKGTGYSTTIQDGRA